MSGDNCIDGDHSYVSIDTINSTTGALTRAETIDSRPCSGLLSVDPFGKFAYVTNWGANNLSMYSIDGATGALSLIGTVPAGTTPTSIAIHPSGKFAYVTNYGSNDVSIYTIDATGVLSLVGSAEVRPSRTICCLRLVVDTPQIDRAILRPHSQSRMLIVPSKRKRASVANEIDASR